MAIEKKRQQVEDLKKTLGGFSVIGLIDMYKTQTRQLQKIRKGLGDSALIKMTKKSILMHALEEMGNENLKKLESAVPTQPAIILTDKEPFKFYVAVKNLRFKTFAKRGDKSKEDIWVYAGPTNLLAGPAISDFQGVGLVAGVEAGKIAIKKDALFVKAGDEIDIKKSNILRKLNIEPVEVTLNVVALCDKVSIYEKEALDLSLAYPSMLVAAYNNALNLSVSVGFPTKANIKQLLTKAVRSANAVNSMATNRRQATAEAAAPAEANAEVAQPSGGVS